jgi:hypothetical protein
MKDYLHTVTAKGRTYYYFRPSTRLKRHRFPPIRLADDFETAQQQAATLAELRPDVANTQVVEHLGVLLKEGRRRARQRKIEFGLTEAQLLGLLKRQNYRCAVSGLEFDLTPHADAFRRPFAPSLDRIDSKRGYVLRNVRIVCCAVNLALNEWGLETFEKICAAVAAKNETGTAKENARENASVNPAAFSTEAA